MSDDEISESNQGNEAVIQGRCGGGSRKEVLLGMSEVQPTQFIDKIGMELKGKYRS